MRLHITGTIDEPMYDKVAEFLGEAEGADVEIYINSAGGNHIDSLAIYSLLRLYEGQVTTTAVGCCQSAAILVLAAGDRRLSAAETWFMVHEDSCTNKGPTSALLVEAAYMRRSESQWAELMADRTGIDNHHWDGLSKATTYFNAVEAHELGLVHKILKGKP